MTTNNTHTDNFIAEVQKAAEGSYMTFAMIKTHASRRLDISTAAVLDAILVRLPAGAVVKRLPVISQQEIHNAFVHEFYHDHAERPYFGDLMASMCTEDEHRFIPLLIGHTAPIVDTFRQIIGSTDAKTAHWRSLRAQFGDYRIGEDRVAFNTIHGSDSVLSAEKEYTAYLRYYFRSMAGFYCMTMSDDGDVMADDHRVRSLMDEARRGIVLDAPVYTATPPNEATTATADIGAEYQSAICALARMANSTLAKQGIPTTRVAISYDPSGWGELPIRVDVRAESREAAGELFTVLEGKGIAYTAPSGKRYAFDNLATMQYVPPGTLLTPHAAMGIAAQQRLAVEDPVLTNRSTHELRRQIENSLSCRGFCVDQDPALKAATMDAALRINSMITGIEVQELALQTCDEVRAMRVGRCVAPVPDGWAKEQ